MGDNPLLNRDLRRLVLRIIGYSQLVFVAEFPKCVQTRRLEAIGSTSPLRRPGANPTPSFSTNCFIFHIRNYLGSKNLPLYLLTPSCNCLAVSLFNLENNKKGGMESVLSLKCVFVNVLFQYLFIFDL